MLIPGYHIHRISRRDCASVLRGIANLKDHCPVFIENGANVPRCLQGKVSRRVGGVNPCIGKVDMFRVIRGSVSADQRVATREHIGAVCYLRRDKTVGSADNIQTVATVEHFRHIRNFGGVPAAQVKFRQLKTAHERAAHIRNVGSIQSCQT